MVTNELMKSTNKYLNSKTKTDRKEVGQFSTPQETATFMAGLSKVQKETVKVLDAGAGSGILSLELLEYLSKNENIQSIEIDLYENDKEFAKILKVNMQKAKLENAKLKNFNIYVENFVTTKRDKKYDIVISNPPYKKVRKNAPEAIEMKDVVYGQPNLYFLFMAKAVKLLDEKGELIFIVPRSWTSGKYFQKFRNVFFENVTITNIHLFASRDKVFGKEKVLQETIILRAVKKEKETKAETKIEAEQEKKQITISQSNSNEDFENLQLFKMDYETCIQKSEDCYVFLPANPYDVEVLQFVQGFTTTLEDIGLQLKTGPTIEFRNLELLEKEEKIDTVPLVSSFHLRNGKVHFPSNLDEFQYVKKDKKAILQKNTNYLFIKRFSSKEEKRRLQPAMFFKTDFENYDYISTENHVNYICNIHDEEIENDLIYGLYAIYNSTVYDSFYRILNGSTQVNASEINNIPIPKEKTIREIRKMLQTKDNLTTKECDEVLDKVLNKEKARHFISLF